MPQYCRTWNIASLQLFLFIYFTLFYLSNVSVRLSPSLFIYLKYLLCTVINRMIVPLLLLNRTSRMRGPGDALGAPATRDLKGTRTRLTRKTGHLYHSLSTVATGWSRRWCVLRFSYS